jgi:hypothetical protein
VLLELSREQERPTPHEPHEPYPPHTLQCPFIRDRSVCQAEVLHWTLAVVLSAFGLFLGTKKPRKSSMIRSPLAEAVFPEVGACTLPGSCAS